MRIMTATACFALLLTLAACGQSATSRAATGGIGGAVAGTVVGGPVGAVAGGVGGATLGAATAD